MSNGQTASEVIFRTARESDLDSIIALLSDDELGRTRENIAPEARPRYVSAFQAIAADPHNELIVAELAGHVVGCLQLTFLTGLTYQGSTRAQIEGVRVASHLRGQSIGRKLFSFTLERARDKGAILVQLTTASGRDDTVRFYKKLGFEDSHIGMKLFF